MREIKSLCLFFILCATSCLSQQKYYAVTAAFYNFENLFDTENDPFTFDDDYTPEGKNYWTLERLSAKQVKLSKVIADLGVEQTSRPPALLGFAEVENRNVVEQLIDMESLQHIDYGLVHYDSPDKRGIDVGLLYDRDLFHLKNSQTHTLFLFDEQGKRIFTRDQLCVSGYLADELIYLIVCHWPSRRGGLKRSQSKRMQAARLTKHIIDSLSIVTKNPKVILMGDFNDNPTDASFKEVLHTRTNKVQDSSYYLYAPMERKFLRGYGSLAYRDQWSLFDQFLVSSPLLFSEGWRYYDAHIFSEQYLKHQKGKYRGYPKRTFERGSYVGGYSDHFPVYLTLVKEVME